MYNQLEILASELVLSSSVWTGYGGGIPLQCHYTHIFMYMYMYIYLQHHALVKVVCAGPSLQGGEGHVAAGQRRDVAELVGARRRAFVLARPQVTLGVPAVRLEAGAAVVLVGQPGAAPLQALVDGEALRTAGVELQAHVGDLEGLPCAGERGRRWEEMGGDGISCVCQGCVAYQTHTYNYRIYMGFSYAV